MVLDCNSRTNQYLGKFASDLIKLNATLEITQGRASVAREYFGESRSHWKDMQEELECKGILMNFSCCHDDNFKFHPGNLHAHIDVMTAGQRMSGFEYSE